MKEIPLRIRITTRQEKMIHDYIKKENTTKSDLVRKSINYYITKKVNNGRDK